MLAWSMFICRPTSNGTKFYDSLHPVSPPFCRSRYSSRTAACLRGVDLRASIGRAVREGCVFCIRLTKRSRPSQAANGSPIRTEPVPFVINLLVRRLHLTQPRPPKYSLPALQSVPTSRDGQNPRRPPLRRCQYLQRGFNESIIYRTCSIFALLMLATLLALVKGSPSSANDANGTSHPAGSKAPVASENLTYDHVHFGVPDPAKAVEWYAKYMGGQPGPADEPHDRLLFGKTRFIFLKTDNPKPSEGSAIDHIGISFPDIDAKMKEFQAAGIKILTPPHDVAGLFKIGFIEDPWGAKIEIVQDPETLGFHHVHLRAPDPEMAFNW